MADLYEPCPMCQTLGITPGGHDPCPECGGDGWVDIDDDDDDDDPNASEMNSEPNSGFPCRQQTLAPSSDKYPSRKHPSALERLEEL